MPRDHKCSFCGKSEVAKLIAGPKVFICDTCVGICNTILEATPKVAVGWDKMNDADLLEALKPASATVSATQTVLQSLVDTLRGREISWEAIGRTLGVSRQAAWERFS